VQEDKVGMWTRDAVSDIHFLGCRTFTCFHRPARGKLATAGADSSGWACEQDEWGGCGSDVSFTTPPSACPAAIDKGSPESPSTGVEPAIDRGNAPHRLGGRHYSGSEHVRS
jgi:hypothetical protein